MERLKIRGPAKNLYCIFAFGDHRVNRQVTRKVKIYAQGIIERVVPELNSRSYGVKAQI